MADQRVKHLLSRAAFGVTLKDKRSDLDLDQCIESLFPKHPPKELTVLTKEEYLEMLHGTARLENKTGTEMKTRGLHSTLSELNVLWLKEMVVTADPLREQMSLFWHGHFAARLYDPFLNQQMLHIIRTHALGSFRDMLYAVSRSPLMLLFLNNKQNIKKKPNENFAREVMELFTLGIGHYTEKDVQEGARAFTGWSYDKEGNFLKIDAQHDTGAKTFLGQTGSFDGEAIIDMLLKEKQTARYVSGKICRYFVGEGALDVAKKEDLAMKFYNSDYDITLLLKTLFSASWFYDGVLIGNRIKSPIEMLVGMRRNIEVRYDPESKWVQLEKLLGQELFLPPNVAGWPGGKSWLRGSALPVRLRLAEALYSSAEIQFTEDANDENEPKMMTGNDRTHKTYSLGKAEVDWIPYIGFWKDVNENRLPETIAAFLLPIALPTAQMDIIRRYADKDSREDLIKSITILVMKTPEYQLS